MDDRSKKWIQTREEESQMIHEQIPNWTSRQVRGAHKRMIPIIQKAQASSLATVRLIDELIPTSMPALTPEPVEKNQDIYFFRRCQSKRQ